MRTPKPTKIISMAALVLLAMCFSTLSYSENQAACTASSLKGTFGYYREGNTPDGPLAAAGTVTYDDNGNWKTRQTISRNGNLEHVVLNGETKIAPDCTYKGYLDGAEITRGVIVDNGNTTFAVSVTSGNTILVIGKRTQPQVSPTSFSSVVPANVQSACTPENRKGTFGFYRKGTTPDGPLVAVGIIENDEQGNFTYTQTISRNGHIERNISNSGETKINPDCTSKSYIDGQEVARGIVVDGGNGNVAVSVVDGNTILLQSRRIQSQ